MIILRYWCYTPNLRFFPELQLLPIPALETTPLENALSA